MTRIRISRLGHSVFNAFGHYKEPVWKRYEDIGQTFQGEKLTRSDYLRVESDYCNFIISLLEIWQVKLYVKEFWTYFLTDDRDLQDYHQTLLGSDNETLIIDKFEQEAFLRLWLRENLGGVLVLGNLSIDNKEYCLYLNGDISLKEVEDLAEENNLIAVEVAESQVPTCFQVTKYNPIFRNDKGHYQKEEWIDFSDIGKSYGGELLTLETYEKVELAYLRLALASVEDFGLFPLTLTDIEIYRQPKESALLKLYDDIKAGAYQFDREVFYNLLRLILRGYIWAKIISEELEIHFGHDLYMYLITRGASDQMVALVEQQNLFVKEVAGLDE